MKDHRDLLTVSMFGELRIRVNNLPIPRISGKAQELFALLVLWNEMPISRKRLASTLWPESKQPNALGLLRTSLMELRKALGPASTRIPTEDRTTLHLDLHRTTVDIIEFDLAVKQGSLDAVKTALTIYSQDLLVGWEAAWVGLEREKRAQAHALLIRAAVEAEQEDVVNQSSPDLSVSGADTLSGASANAQIHGAIAEVRELLEQNHAQLQHSGSQLNRLERLLAGLDSDAPNRDYSFRAQDLYTLGISRYTAGDIEGSRLCQEQALLLAERLDDTVGQPIQAKIIHQLGRLTMNDDKGAARVYFQRAYEIRVQQHREMLRSLVTSLLGLGDVASNLSEALEYYEQARQTAETNQDEAGIAWSHFSIALVRLYRHAWAISDLRETLAHFSRAIAGFTSLEDPTGLFAVLEGLARVCHEVGCGVGAARMIEIEAILRQEYSAPQMVNDTEEATGAIAAIRRDISSSAAAKRNNELDWAAAVKEALDLIRTLPEFVKLEGAVGNA